MKTLSLCIAIGALACLSVSTANAQLLQGIFSGVVQSKVLQGMNGKPGSAPKKEDIKVGDEAYTGQYRIAVTKIQQMDSYTTRYSDAFKTPMTITPMAGQTLIVIDCYAKNATTKPQELVMSGSLTQNTAVIDAKKFAYRPITVPGTIFEGYDVHLDELAPSGVKINPGQSINFAVVFGVPQGFKPNDFVFSALDYMNRATVAKATDVAVHIN
jgi:hypothetical protein